MANQGTHLKYLVPKPQVKTNFFQNENGAIPKPGTTNNAAKSNQENQPEEEIDIFKPDPNADVTYSFTGSVERVIKWHKVFPDPRCLFEVIATIVALKDGTVKLQKIVLLRDDKGPILQVIYYLNNDIQVEDFSMGQKIRCVGHMSSFNTLNAYSIRSATEGEIGSLKRFCHIGDYAISKLINKENAEGKKPLKRPFQQTGI